VGGRHSLMPGLFLDAPHIDIFSYNSPVLSFPTCITISSEKYISTSRFGAKWETWLEASRLLCYYLSSPGEGARDATLTTPHNYIVRSAALLEEKKRELHTQ